MPTQTFKLDTTNGLLQVFAGPGDVRFDSRYSTLKTWMIGNVGLAARNSNIPPNGGTDSYVFIPYGKTFAKNPMIIHLTTATTVDLWSTPGLSFSPTFPGPPFTGAASGAFTTSFLTDFAVGNMTGNAGRAVAYMVVENGVDG